MCCVIVCAQKYTFLVFIVIFRSTLNVASHNCSPFIHSFWEFLQIWFKCSLGLKDERIRFWWPEVHCDLTKHIFVHYSRIHPII